jgi:solute carrier family 25 protein 39/40
MIGMIYKREGIAGLMSGYTARIAKVAPSCAIMISTYEVGKRYFEHLNNIQ